MLGSTVAVTRGRTTLIFFAALGWILFLRCLFFSFQPAGNARSTSIPPSISRRRKSTGKWAGSFSKGCRCCLTRSHFNFLHEIKQRKTSVFLRRQAAKIGIHQKPKGCQNNAQRRCRSTWVALYEDVVSLISPQRSKTLCPIFILPLIFPFLGRWASL